MSETVDKRIVEMRFNNKDFEKNAAQSIKTLDQLKKSLDFDNSTTALDRIAKSVETLEQRFSTLGIVGKRVIENITDSAMNLFNKAESFFSGGIIQGGIKRAMNLENARFTLNGLLDTAEEAQAVLDIAGESVNNTAYSLDQAAVIASQFAASGLTAATAENKLEKAMRGVAGIAAITNSDYASMGRIFTQVSGAGRLMTNDLLQLSTRGMNAAATLTDVFNKVNKGEIEAGENASDMGETTLQAIKDITNGVQITEAELRDLVTKGKISFDIFAESMNSAFGDKAQDADKTLTGAFSNVKAALARIGAEFVSPLIEQEGPLVKFLQTTKAKINDLKGVLTGTIKVGDQVIERLAPAKAFVAYVTDMIERMTIKMKNLDVESIFTPVANITQGILNVVWTIRYVIGSVKDAFRDIFPDASVVKVVTTLSSKFRSFTESIMNTAKTTDKFKRIFRGMWAVIDIGVTALKTFLKIFGGDIANAIGVATGKIFDFSAGIGDGLVGIRDWIKENKVFEKVFTKLHTGFSLVIDILKKLGNVFSTVFGFIKKQVQVFGANAGDGIWAGIKAVGSSVAEGIGSLWDKIKEVMVDGWEWLGSHGPFRYIIDAFNAVKEYFANSPVFEFIISCFEGLKAGIQKVIDGFKSIKMDGADGFVEKLKGKFSWVKSIADFFSAAGRLILSVGKSLWSIIKGVGKGIFDGIEPILNGITDGINKLVSNSDLGDVGLLAAGGGLGLMFKNLGDMLKDAKKVLDIPADITKAITGMINGISNTLKGAKQWLQAQALKSLAQSVLMLAGAMFVMALLPADSVMKGTVAIVTLIKAVSGAMQTLKDVSEDAEAFSGDEKTGILDRLKNILFGGGGGLSLGAQMIAMAAGVAVLTAAVAVLGNMDYETLMKGIVAISIMMKLFAREIASIGDNAANGAKAAAVIFATALAINMLLAPIFLLGWVTSRGFGGDVRGPGAGSVIAGMFAVIALLGAIDLFILGLSKATKGIKPEQGKSMALMLGMMVLVIDALAIVLAVIIASISGLEIKIGGFKFESGGTERLIAAIVAMSVLLLVIYQFMADTLKLFQTEKGMFRKTDNLKYAIAFVLAVALSMTIILAALAPLGMLSVLGLPGILMIGLVAAALVAVIKAMEPLYKVKDPKILTNLAIFMVALAGSVAILVASAIALTSVDPDELLLSGTAIAVAIAALMGIAQLVGGPNSIAAGLNVISHTIEGFAIAAVLFATSIWLMVDAFDKLNDMSVDGSSAISNNIIAICDAIIESAPSIAMAFATVVASIIGAVAETIAKGWGQILISAIDVLHQTVDALIDQIPEIVPKLATIIIQALEALEEFIPTIVERVIVTVVLIIHSIAVAINDHRSEILDAVSKVFEAIANLLAEAIGRFIGVSKKELGGFVKTWGPRIKKLAEAIAAIWAVGKINKWMHTSKAAIEGVAKSSAGLISAFKQGNALGGGGFYGFTSGLQGIAANSNSMFGGLLGTLGRIMDILGPGGTLTVGLGIAAISIAMKYKEAVDNMDTVSKATRQHLDTLDSINERRKNADKENAEIEKAQNKEISEIRKQIFSDSSNAVDDYKDKLKELVDSNGKVKEGEEERVKQILMDVNPAIADNLEIENGIITMNGNKIDSYKELEAEIDNYIKKLEAQRVYESYLEKRDEAAEKQREAQEERLERQNILSDMAKNRGFDSADELVAFVENAQKAAEDIDSIYQVYGDKFIGGLSEDIINQLAKDLEATGDVGKKAAKDLLEKFADPEKYGGYMLHDFLGAPEGWQAEVDELYEKVENVKTGIDKYTDEINIYERTIQNVDQLGEAITKNQYDRMDELQTKLLYDMSDRTNANATELKTQWEDTKKHTEDLIELSKDKTSKITNREIEAAQERMRVAYEEYKYVAELEGQKDFKAQNDYLDSQIKALEDLKVKTEEVSSSVDKATSKVSSAFSGVDMSALKDKIKSGGLSVSDLMSQYGLSRSDANKMYDAAYGVGDFTIEGLNDSVLDGIPEVSDSFSEVGGAGRDTLAKDWKVESPSKVFYQIGRYAILGLLNGITDTSKQIVPTMSMVASMSMRGLESALSAQNPSIRPIVDLSGIQNGSNTISTMINGQRATAANLTGTLSTQIAASINAEQLDAGIDRVVDVVKHLNDNVVALGNRVNHLQVIMDTGAVVGQLAGPMDSALGGIAMYKRRGI